MPGHGWFAETVKTAWNFDQSSWKDHPKLLLTLRIEHEDGTLRTIRSDTSWKAAAGPVLVDAFMNGEVHDARAEQPGWATPEFDNAAGYLKWMGDFSDVQDAEGRLKTVCPTAGWGGEASDWNVAAVLIPWMVLEFTGDPRIVAASYPLSDHGHHERALRVVRQKTAPGYGWMIEKGCTTLTEDLWGGGSSNHVMFGDVDAWLDEYLAGIRPDRERPGFAHVVLQPMPAGDLSWVRAGRPRAGLGPRGRPVTPRAATVLPARTACHARASDTDHTESSGVIRRGHCNP